VTHELQMLVASANATQLAEIADWCADRAEQIGHGEAKDSFLEARDWLNESEGSGISDLADFLQLDYNQRRRNVA
jgi:hypothetical protein